MLSFTCMQASNIEVCYPKWSIPCTMYWSVLCRKVLCTQNTYVHTALDIYIYIYIYIHIHTHTHTHSYIHIYLPYFMTQHTRTLASTNSLYLNCHTGYTYRPTIISRHNISLIRCILWHATVRTFVTGRDLAAAPPCSSYAIIFFHMPFFHT